jgi:hypothetical protein
MIVTGLTYEGQRSETRGSGGSPPGKLVFTPYSSGFRVVRFVRWLHTKVEVRANRARAVWRGTPQERRLTGRKSDHPLSQTASYFVVNDVGLHFVAVHLLNPISVIYEG